MLTDQIRDCLLDRFRKKEIEFAYTYWRLSEYRESDLNIYKSNVQKYLIYKSIQKKKVCLLLLMKLSIYWEIQTLTSFINTYLKKNQIYLLLAMRLNVS